MTQALAYAGEISEASQLAHKTLAWCRRMLGEGHERTLMSTSNLAQVYRTQHDDAKALPLLKKVLAGNRLLHEDKHHPDTLAAMNAVAITHQNLGNQSEALPLLQELVEADRHVLGKDNPDVFVSIANLATLHSDRRDYKSALRLYKEAADGQQRVLGRQHPRTLETIGKAGMCLCHSGDLAAGLAQLEECVAGFTAACGKEHPRTRNYQCEIWLFKHESGQFKIHASIVGIAGRPELNGREVDVVDFVFGKSRYTVEAEEDGKQKRFNLKPGNLLLAPGTVVVAMGLTGAPELNGRKGFVLGWDEAKQRYTVQLGGRTKLVALKPDTMMNVLKQRVHSIVCKMKPALFHILA